MKKVWKFFVVAATVVSTLAFPVYVAGAIWDKSQNDAKVAFVLLFVSLLGSSLNKVLD